LLKVFCVSDYYHLATPALAAQARSAVIYKAQKFSDHAPLTVDYGFTL
jgi:exodeoxyribonuclease-3